MSLKVGEKESGIVWWHWTFSCQFRLSGTGCVQHRVSAEGFFIDKHVITPGPLLFILYFKKVRFGFYLSTLLLFPLLGAFLISYKFCFVLKKSLVFRQNCSGGPGSGHAQGKAVGTY